MICDWGLGNMLIRCLRASVKLAAPLCLLITLLAGCKSNVEKAAEFVSKGVALEQADDAEAAIAAYRQALAIDSESIEARRRLAALNLKTENLEGAQKQYAALLERLPGDIDANQGLAEIALAGIDLQTAAGFAAVPIESDPTSPRTEGIKIALAFYQADAAGNAAEREVALSEGTPDS